MTAPDPPKPPRPDYLSAQTIHDLRTPLMVIRGHAQLVARWLRRNDIAEADAVLTRLAVIDTLLVQLSHALDGIREQARDEKEDDPASS